MSVHRILLAITAVCSIGLAVPRAASADIRNKQTVLTFDKDVQLPGKVLPAGTYIFQLVDSPLSQHLVQVLDRDGRLLAMMFTVPADRLTRTDDTRIVFDESPAGAPFQIKQWFYPGDLSGEEFIYSTHAMPRLND